MSLENEIWRPVVGMAEKTYLVSSLGRVFSYKTSQFIKPYLHKSRCGYYLRFNLSGVKKMAHIMVAEAYPDLVKRPTMGHTQVDHLDGNTLNPAATNLEYKTAGLNLRAYHAGKYIKFNEETIYVKRKGNK